jgi:myo-inositol-1(or 4)-monophosphatase
LTTDWLAVCRAAAEDVAHVLAEMPSPEARSRVVGEGEGGDETTAIDEAAEQAVVERFRSTGEGLCIVSEELGELELRGGGFHVVIDPIDGSLNAKRGIPFFSVSLAIADGARMVDVFFGYVRDYGSGEEWWAERGGGAFLNGAPIEGARPRERIEILSFEATRTDLVAEKAGAMVGIAYRLRIMGSLALSLCHLAAGRVDAVCSLKGARSVDIAAAQLLVRERGLAIDLFEDPPFEAAPLDVEARSRVVAGASREACERLAAALR